MPITRQQHEESLDKSRDAVAGDENVVMATTSGGKTFPLQMQELIAMAARPNRLAPAIETSACCGRADEPPINPRAAGLKGNDEDEDQCH
jgi:hypothetical protein